MGINDTTYASSTLGTWPVARLLELGTGAYGPPNKYMCAGNYTQFVFSFHSKPERPFPSVHTFPFFPILQTEGRGFGYQRHHLRQQHAGDLARCAPARTRHGRLWSTQQVHVRGRLPGATVRGKGASVWYTSPRACVYVCVPVPACLYKLRGTWCMCAREALLLQHKRDGAFALCGIACLYVCLFVVGVVRKCACECICVRVCVYPMRGLARVVRMSACACICVRVRVPNAWAGACDAHVSVRVYLCSNVYT